MPQPSVSQQMRCLPTQLPPTKESGVTEKEGCKIHSSMCCSQIGSHPPSVIWMTPTRLLCSPSYEQEGVWRDVGDEAGENSKSGR